MNISTIIKSVKASEIQIKDDYLIVSLLDGRILSTPLEWFPKLRSASVEQLNNWRFIGDGEGIHWEDLDEDISIEGLLIN
jgi:hypothetical protein